ncbi:MAG: hypothetical protein H7245_09085 [Candidatus Saccharibacteria bacterium]|nr:hypothetical protein [Pseudorhodobacter sp.]
MKAQGTVNARRKAIKSATKNVKAKRSVKAIAKNVSGELLTLTQLKKGFAALNATKQASFREFAIKSV